MRNKLLIAILLVVYSCNSSHLAVIKINGKYGCINKKGNIKIEAKWDYILLDKKTKPVLVEMDGLYGYIDRSGEVLIEPKYFNGELFSEGLAFVANDNEQCGYINIRGDTIIKFKYELNTWGDFSNGLAEVILNDKCGYINKSDSIIVPFEYSVCYPFRSEIAVVMDTNYQFKLISQKGDILEYNEENIGDKEIFPPFEAYPGSIKTKTGQGRINNNGDTIVPPIYSITGNLSDNMYIVKDFNGKWGAYNNKGKLKVIPQFDKLSHFNNGVASFCIDGKWGYINKNGKIIINQKFDYAAIFKYNLAYVELNGKAGFINKTGKLKIPLIFEPDVTFFEK